MEPSAAGSSNKRFGTLALFIALVAIVLALWVWIVPPNSAQQNSQAIKEVAQQAAAEQIAQLELTQENGKLLLKGAKGSVDLAAFIKQEIQTQLAAQPPAEPGSTTNQTTIIQGDENTDSQTLNLSGNSLSISGGNSVTVDGAVGNELSDVVANTGLLRVGAGTVLDPYKVALQACASGEILKSSGSGVWACATDAGGATYTADGQGIELVGTQFSLELNGASLQKSASGLSINLANANTWSALQTMGAGLAVTGDVDASGVYRIGGVQICSSTGCAVSSTSGILNQTAQQTANFNIISVGTGSIGAIIQGASGQSADLFRVNDGAGATQFKVNATGTLIATVKPTATGSTGALELGALTTQSANDINGVIGFWGTGVKHAQIAYSVGDGFYLCDSSAGSPSGDFGQCSTRVNLHGGNGDFNGTLVVGSVGAPIQKFEVQGGDAAIYNSGNNTRLILGDDGSSGQYGYLQWDSTNDYLRIEKNGSNGLKIADNFVTIGNVFPDQPLKVANGTTLLTQINTTGSVQHKTSTNSATAFQVLNASDVPVFVIDTTNGAVKIGGGDVSASATPGLLILDHKSTAGDPTGTNGGMYYNASTNKMRCYENSVWKNCLGLTENITFNATSGAGSTSDWDDVPNATVAEMFFANPLVANAASRIKYDLTEATEARLQFNVELVSGSATNTEARVQYSTDQSSWNYLDGGTGPAVNITTTGIHVSSWATIAAGAKSDVFLRIIGTSGDGTTDYDVGVVALQVR